MPAVAFRSMHGRILVEVGPGGGLPMAAITQAGKGLDWLAEEPELYSDADLIMIL
ncbi:MAG: hypothetical protein QOH05_1439 [Acetobacteraceae bacterium]|nr:hypothetical protein [Acetobacteraceae bacterium]